jgi:DNA-binding GntR family transcriptional regulator
MQPFQTTARGEQLHQAPAKTLAEAIYNRLRQDILSGQLKPGSKLRFTDLKGSYRAGMSTLRESLSKLSSDRLVIAEGQRGFRVAPVSRGELWDITRLRADLEAAALDAAIDRGGDEWEANIIAAFHRLSKFAERSKDVPYLLTEEGALLHKSFHMALFGACPSMWRLRVIDLLYDHSERYRRLFTSHLRGKRNSEQEHREIMQAAIDRHKQLAVALLTRHLEKTAETLAKIDAVWTDGSGADQA